MSLLTICVWSCLLRKYLFREKKSKSDCTNKFNSYLAMKETIRQVKEKYGSIEGYVKDECKLTDAEIKKVKDLMIVPIRFEERQLFRPKI